MQQEQSLQIIMEKPVLYHVLVVRHPNEDDHSVAVAEMITNVHISCNVGTFIESFRQDEYKIYV